MKRKTGDKEKDYFDILKNNLNCKNVYGFKEDEFERIKQLIMAAKPNSEPSKFPDFLIDNGFIELFEITSSFERNKGGSKMKEETACFDKKYEKGLKEYINSKQNDGLEFGIYEQERSITGHSHEFIINSLQRNIENHIESLGEYHGPTDTSIFYIQYTDNALFMRHSNTHGRLSYMLSRDIDALKILEKYNDSIKYVIFLSTVWNKVEFEKTRIPEYKINPSIEIIKTSELVSLINSIGEKYTIYPLLQGQITSSFIVTGSSENL